MSSTNVVLEVPPNIAEAWKLLDKRLHPAKLKVDGAEGKKNGFIFRSWVIAKNLDLSSMTGQAIAEEMFQAVVHDCHQPLPQFQWVTPPKTLLVRVEQAKNRPAKYANPQETNDLAGRSRAADVEIKAQEAAKKRCYGLVDRFTPVRRGGVRAYAIQDEKQKEWRAKIAKTTDFVKLEKVILAESEEVYTQLERAAQV